MMRVTFKFRAEVHRIIGSAAAAAARLPSPARRTAAPAFPDSE
jgi:hypothetical protein